MLPQIFVSYSRKDSAFVRRLVDDLTSRGVDIWLDQRDIKAGERWDRSVQNGLRESDYFMVVLSPESVASENVMDEIAYAMSKAKHVFPILYRDCDVPYRLARVQYVDFRGEYENGIERLLGQMQLAGVPIRQAEGSTGFLPEAANRDEPLVETGERAKVADRGAKIPVWAWGVGGAALLVVLVLVLLFANRDHPVASLTPSLSPEAILVAVEASPTSMPVILPPTDTEAPATPMETSAGTLTPSETVSPTETKTPTPGTPYPAPDGPPVVSNVRFCNKPCSQIGAVQVKTYPEKTKYVYFTLDYDNFYPGMKYTRTWSNEGDEWIRYDCSWKGDENGSKDLRLYDTKGLRSGLWVMEIISEGKRIGYAEIRIKGSYDYWSPAGTQSCRDF